MLDVGRFLVEQFGDTDGVVGLLSKHNLEVPSKPAVEKWFSRASLTGTWLAELQVAVERETGSPVRMELYRDGHDIFG